MTEKVRRKAGRKPGSIVRTKEFDDIVFSHIPEDGKTIQHKDLMVLCVHSGKMAYQSMQDALNRLQLKGVVGKEKIKTKKERKAGTYYRRTKQSLEFYKIFPINGFQATCEKVGFTLPEQTLKTLWEEYHITISTIWHEFIFYTINPDKEQAQKRLKLVFTDIIVSELMKIADKIPKTK